MNLSGKFVMLALLLSYASLGEASYEVPGENGNTSFNMAVNFQTEGSKLSISYTLPLELTGAPNHIHAVGEMTGPDEAILSSLNSELKCRLSEKFCEVRYKNLVFDLEAVKSRLQQNVLSAVALEEGLKISRQFESDPIGIVRF